MIRSKVLGIGSYVPERVVTNHELPFLNQKHEVCEEKQIDTNHDWIVQRSGIEERRYVPLDGTVTSDLGVEAAKACIADAGIEATDIDCIILGTLSPDIHFPGTAVFVQHKLGIHDNGCACYDIRQQCSAFVYGLEMADAFIQAKKFKRVLVIGAELHSHSLEFSTRGRAVTVLFGDGAGAMLLGPEESEPEGEELAKDKKGVIYTQTHANGSGAWGLYLKAFDIGKSPMVYYDGNDYDQNMDMWPQMQGRAVFMNAVKSMVASVKQAMQETGLTWDDIDWFVPHQANLRINETVVQYAKIPPEKTLNTIMFYGNTTAATVPLTIDYWRKEGKVKEGDLILSTVFGAGFTWGTAIFRV